MVIQNATNAKDGGIKYIFKVFDTNHSGKEKG